MASYLEKRKSTRLNTEGTIILYSNIKSIKDTNANLIDFSDEGISFSTSKRMSPGTTIFFKSGINNCLGAEEDAGSQIKAIGLVTVKWCRNSSKKDHYEIGANYKKSPIDLGMPLTTGN